MIWMGNNTLMKINPITEKPWEILHSFDYLPYEYLFFFKTDTKKEVVCLDLQLLDLKLYATQRTA